MIYRSFVSVFDVMSNVDGVAFVMALWDMGAASLTEDMKIFQNKTSEFGTLLSAQAVAGHLIDVALELGSYDNISAIVVKFKKDKNE